MAYIVMACIVMAYIVMAFTVMAVHVGPTNIRPVVSTRLCSGCHLVFFFFLTSPAGVQLLRPAQVPVGMCDCVIARVRTCTKYSMKA